MPSAAQSLLQPQVPLFGASAPMMPATTQGDLVPPLPSKPLLGFGDFCWKPSTLAPKGNVCV